MKKSISEKSSFLTALTGNVVIALATTFFIYSCSHNKVKMKIGIQHVNISEAFGKNEEVPASEIVNGTIEYIPLETSKDFLIGASARIFASDLYIIATTKNQIYLFDRKTGKFIHEIGHHGKGPGEYGKVGQAFVFDEERQLVYTGGWEPKSYYRYNLNGEFTDKITAWSIEKEEDMMNNVFGEIITSIAPLNDTSFVGYVWNLNGKQEAKLIAFSENNHRIRIFPQYKHFDYDIKRDGISVFSWNAKYYQLDHQLHFFERFTDTVFTVSLDTLQPKFVLHKGETENATATDFTKNKGDVSYFLIENIFESNRYLFFKTRSAAKDFEGKFYYGFFDKTKGNTSISKNEAGLTNDVTGFLPFTFQWVTQQNELVGMSEAYEVKLWFDENPEKAAKLPANLQKLKDINETDNPVVMIAKLKK